MDGADILKKLAKSGRLATQTHKRTLTRTLLNRALGCNFTQGTQAGNVSLNSDYQPPLYSAVPRCDKFRQQHSQNNSYGMKDISSNFPNYDEKKVVPHQKCRSSKACSQQDKGNVCQQDLTQERTNHQCMVADDDHQYIRNASQQLYTVANNWHMRVNKGNVSVRPPVGQESAGKKTVRKYIQIGENFSRMTTDEDSQCMRTDGDYQPVRADGGHQTMQENRGYQPVRADGGYQPVRADRSYQPMGINDGYQPIMADNDFFCMGMDDHQYGRVDNGQQIVKNVIQLQKSGKNQMRLREIDDTSQYIRTDGSQQCMGIASGPLFAGSVHSPHYEGPIDLRQGKATIVNLQYKGTSTDPQYKGTSTDPQYKRTSAGPQYKGTSTDPQYKGTSTDPQYKGTSTDPQFKRTSAGLQFTRTSAGPQFTRTSVGPQYKGTRDDVQRKEKNNPQYKGTNNCPLCKRNNKYPPCKEINNDGQRKRTSNDQSKMNSNDATYQEKKVSILLEEDVDKQRNKKNSGVDRKICWQEEEQPEDSPEECSDEEQQDGCDIDATMKQMSAFMNNISHLCECYYDSCQKDCLSLPEKRHLNSFHVGVLPDNPEKTSEECKKSCETTPSTSSWCSEDEEVEENIDPDPADENSHHTKVSDSVSGVYNCSALDSALKGTHNSNFTEAYRRFNYVPSDEALTSSLPSKNTSSTCVSFGSTIKKNISASARYASQKHKESLTGVSLPKSTFVEGISVFPTDKISFQTKSGKGKRKPAMYQKQGIYISTKPGTYVVRKPCKESSIHLLHVDPGRYIQFQM